MVPQLGIPNVVYRYLAPLPSKNDSNCVLGSAIAVVGMPITTWVTRHDQTSVCLEQITNSPSLMMLLELGMDTVDRLHGEHLYHHLLLLCTCPFPAFYTAGQSGRRRAQRHCAPHHILSVECKFVRFPYFRQDKRVS